MMDRISKKRLIFLYPVHPVYPVTAIPAIFSHCGLGIYITTEPTKITERGF